MALSGDLSDVDIKTLLNLISQTKDTGKLTIKSDSLINVYFKGGHPINADGDKTPVSSMEKVLSLNKGVFEFVKTDSVQESTAALKIEETFSRIDSIRDQWKTMKSQFPNYNVILNLAEAKGEEINLTAEDWNILSLVRVPTTLAELVRQSPYGELKTLTVLSDIFSKKLLTVSLIKDDSLRPEDVVIPVKESGYFAANTPIYGEHNLAFYKRIDNRKDFETICKEMKMSFGEGREILKYLVSQGKVSLRKKTR